MTTSSGPHAVADRRTTMPVDPPPDPLLDPPRDSSDPRLRSRRAALLHLDGDLAGAEAGYRAVLDDDPTNASALNNLGLLLSQRGDAAGALTVFERLGPEESLSPTALVNLAHVQMALGDATRATAMLERAVLTDPGSTAWAALGQVRLVTGDVGGAEAALRESLDRHPPRPDVLRSYGACLAARGALDEAGAAFRAALRLDDTDASSWRQLAAVLLAERDLGSAVRAARRATELDPESVTARRELAVALVAIGDAVEAAEHLDQALDLSRDADLLVDRAVLYLAADEADRAEPLLEKASHLDATGRARLYLAYAQLAQKKVDEARASLEAVATMDEPFATQAAHALANVRRADEVPPLIGGPTRGA